MKIFIFLLFIAPSTFAQDIDWAKMDQEMEYLRQNAFVDKEENMSHIQKDKNKETKAEKRSYSLQRKPKSKKNLDPNILPLEQEYFDEVNLKYSAPNRVHQSPKTKEQIKNSITTPSLPNLEF